MLEQRVQPIVLIGEQAIARPALPADEAVDQLPTRSRVGGRDICLGDHPVPSGCADSYGRLVSPRM